MNTDTNMLYLIWKLIPTHCTTLPNVNTNTNTTCITAKHDNCCLTCSEEKEKKKKERGKKTQLRHKIHLGIFFSLFLFDNVAVYTMLEHAICCSCVSNSVFTHRMIIMLGNVSLCYRHHFSLTMISDTVLGFPWLWYFRYCLVQGACILLLNMAMFQVYK